MLQPNLRSSEKVFRGDRVWGFTGFEVANYLIFREKVPQFFAFCMRRKRVSRRNPFSVRYSTDLV
ncbi:hypothetical protein [Microcystis aeruginosa]|uniref:hypothetical protein n=1 Tax=Microcystis aeruginosa TaxID=1126 RepID=UPI0002D94F2C